MGNARQLTGTRIVKPVTQILARVGGRLNASLFREAVLRGDKAPEDQPTRQSTEFFILPPRWTNDLPHCGELALDFIRRDAQCSRTPIE